MKFAPIATLLASATAMSIENRGSPLRARTFSCTDPVKGLTQAACEYLSSIKFLSQGMNSFSSNDGIWIGDDGVKWNFVNQASNDVILVGWTQLESNLLTNQAQITYVIKQGESVTISTAKGSSGAFAGIYGSTTLTGEGLLDNTWVEYNLGSSATMDVNRDINMLGNHIAAEGDNGCQAQYTDSAITCAYECLKGATSCTGAGESTLVDCDGDSNPGAGSSGCTGWGSVTVTLQD